MMRIALLFLSFLFCSTLSAQKDIKLKTFAEFQSKRAFSDNNTKYYGFNLGVRAKCKFKVGVSYTWLRGSFETDKFPVDTNIFLDASDNTKTSARFFSLLVSPIVLTRKRLNISLPVNFGVAGLTSDYASISGTYVNYHNKASSFGEVGADLDFRLSMILKFGVSFSYRHLFTDLEVAEEAFNTPLFGFKIKLGRMCR